MIYDAHQDIAANIQLVTGKDFFKQNGINEGYLNTNYRCINQVDYFRLRKGNVKLVFATIFAKTKKQAIEQFHIYKNIIKKGKDKIIPIFSSKDLARIKGKSIGFLFHMEGAGPIEKKTDLDYFYKLGLRSIGICWRTKNQYVGKNKLTKKGIELIKYIEGKKMIIDLAHTNENLFCNILKYYNKRFIVSHTACKPIYSNKRNLSYRQIMEIINRKSLIGICGVNALVGGCNISNIIKNIKYIIRKGGINNLCFGSDFDGMVNPKIILIKGFEDVSCYPNLIKKLLQAFNNKVNIKKIANKNLKEFIGYAL